MNLLIVAGLLAFALVAILAAVLLALAEQKAESKLAAVQVAAKPTDEQQTKALVPEKKEQAASINKQNLPVLSKTTLPVSTDALNGQFHEFAAEIHALHIEAELLEQRLSVLVEMVDHVERTQSGHVSIEEELTLPVNATPV